MTEKDFPVIDTDGARDPDEFIKQAKEIVVNHYNSLPENFSSLHADEVYIVWFSKVLWNWKAIVSTEIPDGKIYEVTYDGEKFQTYLDVYTKASNHVIPD